VKIVTDKQIVVDAGSTKYVLCKAVQTTPCGAALLHASYVGHGIQRTGSCSRKMVSQVVHVFYCEKEKSDPKAVEIVENIYRDLGMHIVYMDAQPHDVHLLM